ncbi:MAG TPA: ModE family transcriptional regulator [Syntrophobacteraceae bacterium]|nr:ModE family transcriptional regulator [Syntrophobacteraceae bacterium]HBZ57496.1 ModE family transcriptional regulator [Syntrophobacteraceae bacterium]
MTGGEKTASSGRVHRSRRRGERTSSVKSSPFVIKSKIWIEDHQGNVVFGAGRLLILSAIEQHGSILAAAKELGMSYRAVWGKIKATEDRLKQPLLTKRTGGTHGGGSELTPFGKALLDHFRHLEALTRTSADTLFRGFFVDALAEDEPIPGEEQ